MHVMDAAHLTVRDYPGGGESLAPRVGMSPAILRNKCNPNVTTHRLAIDEASTIMAVTGDFRMLHALAEEHAFVCRRVDEGSGNDRSMLDLLLSAEASKGAFAQAVADALADGLITEREMRQIDDAGLGMQSTVMLLLNKLRTLTGVRVSV